MVGGSERGVQLTSIAEAGAVPARGPPTNSLADIYGIVGTDAEAVATQREVGFAIA